MTLAVYTIAVYDWRNLFAWTEYVIILCVIFQILKILNSNTENPYLIWDNATRAELAEFLMDQQQQKIRTVRMLSICCMDPVLLYDSSDILRPRCFGP